MGGLKKADTTIKTTKALDRLASLFEYGALLACTDPPAFLEKVATEVEELRDAVGGLALIVAAQALRDRLDCQMWDDYDAASDAAALEAHERRASAIERERRWDR